MDHRHVCLRNFRISTGGEGKRIIAEFVEIVITVPSIGDDRGLRHYGVFYKSTERLGATVVHDGESNTPGVAAVPPFIKIGLPLSPAYFNRTGDKNLIMNAAPLASRAAAHPRFVHLNMFVRQSANSILIWPHHPRA